MKNYHRLETLILRTPTNSLSQLEKLQDLSLLMKDKSFLEALYISSPALYNEHYVRKTNTNTHNVFIW